MVVGARSLQVDMVENFEVWLRCRSNHFPEASAIGTIGQLFPRESFDYRSASVFLGLIPTLSSIPRKNNPHSQ
ncbi:hypothetical protein TNCV_3995641 [Trichonephila clavipes]|nr:hypothetical protein TNCV_3995641 [Trichonephila clavipes]